MKNPTYHQSTATLAEVARQAGVSRQTAGRILGNGASKHKPQTVERVQRIAEELGYRPNLLAKSVVSGRTNSIGILFPRSNNDDFFHQVVTGIQDALEETDLVPIILYTSNRVSERRQIHRLIDRRVDGVLLIPQISQVDTRYFYEISQRNIPVVCINSTLQNIEPVDFVGTDEFAGGKAAAEYLLDQGHTALCSVQYGGISENLDLRSSGFEQSVRRAGAACTALKLPDWTLEENLEMLCDFINVPNGPTAYFCISDLFAAMLYQAAERTGKTIPDDFSVVGFADLDFSKYLSPPLTTIKQDGYQTGRTAVSMLTARMNGKKDPPEEIRHSTELIERSSVKPRETSET